MFATVSRTLLAVSHSGNLMIYCVSNQSFRNILYQQLCGFKCLQNNRSRYSSQNALTCGNTTITTVRIQGRLLGDHVSKAQPTARSAENVNRLQMAETSLFLQRNSLT